MNHLWTISFTTAYASSRSMAILVSVSIMWWHFRSKQISVLGFESHTQLPFHFHISFRSINSTVMPYRVQRFALERFHNRFLCSTRGSAPPEPRWCILRICVVSSSAATNHPCRDYSGGTDFWSLDRTSDQQEEESERERRGTYRREASWIGPHTGCDK